MDRPGARYCMFTTPKFLTTKVKKLILSPQSCDIQSVSPAACDRSSLDRKAPDMKRLSRPLKSSLRRDVRRGSRASREASVILLPGSAKLSTLEPRDRPTLETNNRKRNLKT